MVVVSLHRSYRSPSPLPLDLSVPLFDALPDGVVVANRAGRIVFANAALEALFGWSVDELLTMSVDELVPLQQQEAHGTLRDQFHERPRPRTMADVHSEVHGIHRDGSLIPVDVALASLASSDHGVLSVAVVRDTSESRQDRRRIGSSEYNFRSAFTLAPVPMVISGGGPDLSNPILEANDAFRALLQLGADAPLPSSIAAVCAQGCDQTEATSAHHAVERKLLRQDGTHVWCSHRASSIVAADGSERSLSHFVDITARVEAEVQRDRREKLLRSLADIRSMSLLEQPIDDVLHRIVEVAAELLDAKHVFVAIPSLPGQLSYRALASHDEARLVGMPVDSAVDLFAISQEDSVVNFVDLPSQETLGLSTQSKPLGPTVVAPLIGGQTAKGVLVAVREADSDRFSDQDEAVAATMASEVAISLELSHGRSDRRRMALVGDRERIARDLHDVVIQRIFAAGMSLQASMSLPDRLQQTAHEVVDELDETIAVIRETIFHLTAPDLSLEGDIVRVIDRIRSAGRVRIDVTTEGDLRDVPPAVRPHIVPILTELLSNVERHANAQRCRVELTVGELVAITVNDDGDGMPDDRPSGFGLRNIRSRAHHLGGSATFATAPDGGASVTVSFPMTAPDAG